MRHIELQARVATGICAMPACGPNWMQVLPAAMVYPSRLALSLGGDIQAGNERAAACALVPMQRHFATAHTKHGTTLNDWVVAMAGQRASDHIAHPGDTEAAHGVDWRSAGDDTAVCGFIAEADDCARHVRTRTPLAWHTSRLRPPSCRCRLLDPRS